MLLGSLGLGPRPTICLALAILIVFSQLPSVALGLRTTAGSPCEDVCHRGATNTTSSEIVCLDRQYNNTSKGTNFQQCVDCQLKSSFSDEVSGESDVSWGLYNLRYAFTTCIYGYPQQINNITSPCVVSCSSMAPALDDNILNPSSIDLFDWCGSSAFADVVVDQCEFCYNLTTTQAYMANFLEALRYNCHFRTPSGTSFPITPARIFTQSQLPSSSRSLVSPSATPGSTKNLPVIIAVPIVAFIVIVCSLSICCFFFIRHRRKKAREHRGLMHPQFGTPAPGTWGQYPMQPGVQDPAMMSPAMHGYGGYGNGYGYGYGPGVGFMDNDGRGQDVGFGKSDVGVAQPSVAVTSTNNLSEQEEEKGSNNQGQQTFFPPPGVSQPRSDGA